MVCSKCQQNGHNSRTCKNASPLSITSKAPPTPSPPSPPSPPSEEPDTKRWTVEEDAHILQLLQQSPSSSSSSPPVWDVQAHNERFHKQRTDATYKQRIKKIAQENNISIRTNNRWTEEEKNAVIEAVRVRPLAPDWEEISTSLHRSEHTLKSMYYELVPPLQHIQTCLAVVQPTDILQVMESLSFQCVRCGTTEYSAPYFWKEEAHCEACFLQWYGEEVAERWRLVRAYSVQVKKNACNLCGRIAVFDNMLSSRFHYDHIDMFNKSESIYEMVRTGQPVDDIYREIDKCQLLCISCHKVVTKMEHLCGFVRLKKQMEDTEENREANSKVYEELMKKIYDFIRSQKKV